MGSDTMDVTDHALLHGLPGEEVSRRLREEGYNELPATKSRSVFAIAFDVVREPMFLLLVSCGAIYLFLGDVREALMLLSFVFVVMGITLYQERKTERALEALRDLSSPRALVIRDGERRRIPGREVVRDDLLVLAEGDRVPADALLLSCTNFTVDESLLTGESVPVRKATWDGVTTIGRPGGDDLPFVYSGSMVVQGHGIARVQTTGLRTELGKIGKALQTVEEEETPLQRETGRLVRTLAVAGLFLCVLVVVVYGLTRGDWIDGILAGLTLAMAMVPEEFPVVLTVFLALGAWRISKRQVLTRRAPAVETLGSTTVLCVDKTGTLTMNRMAVRKLFADGKYFDCEGDPPPPLPETFHELVEFSVLASQRDPFDPMEKALRGISDRFLARTEHLHKTGRSSANIPCHRSFSPSPTCGSRPTTRNTSSPPRGRPRRWPISAIWTRKRGGPLPGTSTGWRRRGCGSSAWPGPPSGARMRQAASTISRSGSWGCWGSPILCGPACPTPWRNPAPRESAWS